MSHALIRALALAALGLSGCSDAAPPVPPPVSPAPSGLESAATPAPGEIYMGTTPADPTATASFTGAVRGRVTVVGAAATPHVLRVDGAPEWARGLRDPPREDPAYARTDDGGVPDAFVYADRGPHRNVLWQVDANYRPRVVVRDCLLAPRVFGLMSGETLRIVNSDPAEHGLVFRGERTGRLVVRAPADGMLDHTFRVDDVVVGITHTDYDFTTGWMWVLDHPFFATTDADGAFGMSDLPPGDYTFVAWHETFGRVELEVAVDVDRTSSVEIRLPGPRAASPPPR